MILQNVLQEKTNKYGYSLLSDAHDTDADGFLRPSAVLRYMQTAVNLQMHSSSPSNDELRSRGQAFVLMRMAFECFQPIKAYQELYAQTWALQSRGFSFGRCYEILKEGQALARAQSVWALIDIESKKPLPVSAFEAGFEIDEPFEDPLPLRISMPEESLFIPVGHHRVSYAETDVNCHMNNTCYPDMLVDFLSLEGKRVHTITLNFCREAKRNENLTIHHAEKDGVHFFRTYREDGLVNIEAAVTISSFS